MGIWYTTREKVKESLDFKETARNNRQVDEAIESATQTCRGQLLRTYEPHIATHSFDWPNWSYSRAYRLWLDDKELITDQPVVQSGGVTIPVASLVMYPTDGPPYNRIELSLASSAAWGGGTTHQSSIVITGLYGYQDEQDDGGLLAAAIVSTSATTLDMSTGQLQVGHLIKIDTERMNIVERTSLDTGQNALNVLPASVASDMVSVADASSFTTNETITIGSERMLVVDVVGNTLVVKRAWDGSTLAAHLENDDVYALRRYTVERGACGTTAATHLIGATVTFWRVPGALQTLCRAEALNILLQDSGGWGRFRFRDRTSDRWTGGEIGGDLSSLRDLTRTAIGRKARQRAV
jgi:hypothetical protein